MYIPPHKLWSHWNSQEQAEMYTDRQTNKQTYKEIRCQVMTIINMIFDDLMFFAVWINQFCFAEIFYLCIIEALVMYDSFIIS